MGNLIQIYHLQTISYTILSAGMQSYSNTYYSLFILISGNGTLKTNHETIHLMKGKCVIIPPNSPVEIHIADETLCFYQLTFNTIYLSEAHTPTSLFTSVRELRLLPFSQCNRLLEAIYRCRQTKDEHTVFEQHVRFQELILFIFEQNRTKPLQQSDRQSVEQSIQYLHNHFGKDWTVEQLAELAGVPKWSYSRIFKDITGQIPLYYLNSIRIEKAKQLLMTTNDRVFEISQSIGFNNEYYFNRRFKEHVGISPGQFRRSQSNNVRVFAPFLEDFFVALGITPIAQFSHSKWGKQDYLGLQDAGIERWETCLHLNKLAPICHLNNPGEDWQSTLFKIADLTGKTAMMQDIITEYEDKVQRARKILGRSVYGQSVAFLRISAIGITLYAGPDCGYTGPILYRDLGLTPDPLVWKIPLNQRKAHLTSNQLQQLEADHLFITFDKQHSIYENEERTILTSSMWKNLRAVKRNCVYEVDFLTWMNYGILSHSKKIDDVLNVLG